MSQHHVNESKDVHGKHDLRKLAANLLKGTASVLDGSNELHSAEQYGPGTHTITFKGVGRVFDTAE